MVRTSKSFKVDNLSKFKAQLLEWSRRYDEIVWLDSNFHNQTYGQYDAILAIDALSVLSTNSKSAFLELKHYQEEINDWIFGHINYDLKNSLEKLSSSNFDGLDFPELFMFQPKRMVFLKADTVTLKYHESVKKLINSDFKIISEIEIAFEDKIPKNIEIQSRISKESYLDKVNQMLSYIHRGDIYEANFCQEFYATNTKISPINVYNYLNKISKPPFASFLKNGDKYIMSASPERYLAKRGSQIISQPIKGTAKRSVDRTEDYTLKHNLKVNSKERSENIMIVDLVRNDLSHTAIRGSVKVKELCEVYSFDQVHQMISTISSKVEDSTHPVDIISTTFPMGSMTGAPKVSAMKIIEELEETKRGVYSGAVGYFSPTNDFDFNVIIRSILYNDSNKYVSFSVGSAITSKSDPNLEYDECIIKAKAMNLALNQ